MKAYLLMIFAGVVAITVLIDYGQRKWTTQGYNQGVAAATKAVEDKLKPQIEGLTATINTERTQAKDRITEIQLQAAADVTHALQRKVQRVETTRTIVATNQATNPNAQKPALSVETVDAINALLEQQEP